MAALAAETLITIGRLPITNTLLHTVMVDAVLIGGAYYISRHIQTVPGLVQNAAETVAEMFYNIIASVSKDNVQLIFPYVVSFFLFILVANWTSLLPGFGSISYIKGEEHIHLFRGATSDLNVTLALALVSIVVTHAMSIRVTGIKDYLSRFFSLNPILLAIGLLEIVSEFTKVVSLSFRLFGNVFAGEQVLATVSELLAFIFPLPFLMLEIIVGVVQALVFAMLTMAFMAIFTTPHHQEH